LQFKVSSLARDQLLDHMRDVLQSQGFLSSQLGMVPEFVRQTLDIIRDEVRN
jgi:hypothetical protein